MERKRKKPRWILHLYPKGKKSLAMQAYQPIRHPSRKNVSQTLPLPSLTMQLGDIDFPVPRNVDEGWFLSSSDCARKALHAFLRPLRPLRYARLSQHFLLELGVKIITLISAMQKSHAYWRTSVSAQMPAVPRDIQAAAIQSPANRCQNSSASRADCANQCAHAGVAQW
jgi:hypothetical protein